MDGPTPPAGPARPAHPAWVHGVLFVALLGAQAAGFAHFVRHEVLPLYPTGYDQIGYLLQSYEFHEALRADGFAAAWARTTGWSPTGVLLPVEAALLYPAFGTGREVALALNLAHWFALQLAFAATLWWQTRNWYLVWLGLALLVTASSPYQSAGSLTDFRHDFGAMCLYGVALCAVVRSGVFRDRRWSVAAGLAIAYLILWRFLSAVYLVGLFCAVGAALAPRAWRRGEPGVGNPARARLGNLLLAGCAVTAVVLPVLWQHRNALYAYYVGNHLVGDEKEVRQLEFGANTALRVWAWYVISLWTDHLGSHCLRLLGVALGACAWLAATRPAGPGCAGAGRTDGAALVLGAAVLIPLAVLTANPSKSPVVGGFVLVPVVWLAVLAAGALAARGSAARFPAWAGCVLVSVLIAYTVWHAWGVYVKQRRASRSPEDWARLAELYAAIGEHGKGLPKPALAVNTVSDRLNYAAVRQWFYEHHGRDLPIHQTLGVTLFEMPDQQVRDRLEASDLIVWCDPQDESVRHYPVTASMNRLGPELSAWCERARVLVWEGTILTQRVRLFARPAPGSKLHP